MKHKPIQEILAAHTYHQVIPFSSANDIVWLDLTEQNKALEVVNMVDTQLFNQYIFDRLLKGRIGVGGYGENRIIYRRSEHYQGEEPRSIHLGIDLWVPANTPVYTPLEGKIYGIANNKGFGNYGPTIILEHELDDCQFFSLYGHLSRTSLQGKACGDTFQAGEKVGETGNYPENGDWPPHLHFQLMTSMLDYQDDFPGVAAPSQAENFLKICPDPNLILQLPR